ncbi:MAG: DUF1287 domain-containing protein [Kofleriaceae bacterium]|nr:DUF1287 domain-containing protein [Kofleriaceae bacterium]
MAVAVAISVGCDTPARSEPGGPAPAAPGAAARTAPGAPAETCLGVRDKGIWSDLDDDLQLGLPAGLSAARVTATIDRGRSLLIVSVDGWPTKPYPLGGPAILEVGEHALALRPGDRAELAGLLTADNTRPGVTPAARDRDRDGIPDALDVLIGAHKTRLNAAAYTEGYVSIPYPGGDVPREMGVCTDVVIRALRNAGLDLQRAVHEDIRRAPRAYPMVKGKGSPSIDHRRVKTILPWFRRHLDERSPAVDDEHDPLRPGDIVFLDTFPSRPGPDHIGIVGDRRGADGLPVVINNWTNGTVTAEMELLGWVPVTHRFRMK